MKIFNDYKIENQFGIDFVRITFKHRLNDKNISYHDYDDKECYLVNSEQSVTIAEKNNLYKGI
jgi:hypothetical protein